MWAEFDWCRDHGRIKFTCSPRTYRSGKHHRRLVCYKNRIDYILNKNKPSVARLRARMVNYYDSTSN